MLWLFKTAVLKGPWHEIYDLWFFPRRPIWLKYFWIWLRIRGENLQIRLHSGINYTAVHVTVVSMTTLYMSRRCQWYRFAYHSGVNDTAVQPTLSNIFGNDPKYWILCWNLRRLHTAPRCHWHRCDMYTQWCQWNSCANMRPLLLWTSYSIGSGYI
jgi:hypothetical protein